MTTTQSIVDLLDIGRLNIGRCSGTARTGLPCNMVVARASCVAAEQLSRQIRDRPLYSEQTQTMLYDLAGYLLCKRWHQPQASKLVAKWNKILLEDENRRDEVEAQLHSQGGIIHQTTRRVEAGRPERASLRTMSSNTTSTTVSTTNSFAVSTTATSTVSDTRFLTARTIGASPGESAARQASSPRPSNCPITTASNDSTSVERTLSTLLQSLDQETLDRLRQILLHNARSTTELPEIGAETQIAASSEPSMSDTSSRNQSSSMTATSASEDNVTDSASTDTVPALRASHLECGICAEEYTDDEILAECRVCANRTHHNCFEEWRQVKGGSTTCTYCRAAVGSTGGMWMISHGYVSRTDSTSPNHNG